MATKVGVGESTKTNSFDAGSEAAGNALKNAGKKTCNFVLLFSIVGYNLNDLLNVVISATGDAPVSGCSGEGVITQNGPQGEVIFTSDSMDWLVRLR